MRTNKLVALMLVVLLTLSCLPVAFAEAKPEYAEITVEVFDRGTDGGKTNPIDNNWVKWIQEKLLADENIGVTFVAVPRGEEVQGLTNLVSSQTNPDVAFTYTEDVINGWATEGGVLDLAPYIDTLLPDLKAFLGADPSLPGKDLIERNRNVETGAIYSLPARRTNVAMRNIFVRQDWLDALGMEVPTNQDEFYEMLKAFKEKNPGNVDNVIPFSMTDDLRWQLGNIVEAFIDPDLSLEDDWVMSIVDRHMLKPGYKEGFRYVNKLYNEGLIDPDFPLYTSDDALYAVVKSGRVGAFSANWDRPWAPNFGINLDLGKIIPGAKFVAVDAMVDANGDHTKGCYDPKGLNYFVFSGAKNPEAAIRYINWLAKPENLKFLQIGEEGVVHKMVDGAPVFMTDEEKGPWIQNAGQNIDYTLMVNGLSLGSDEANMAALASGYPDADPADLIAGYNISMNEAKAGPVIPAVLTAAELYVDDLQSKSKILYANAVVAKPEDFDKLWDDGVADWLASGAQEVMDERAAKFVAP